MATNFMCYRWAYDTSSWAPTLMQLAQAVAIVQLEERTRLMKFVFINDFLSSLIGRLLMRKFVNVCTGLSYEEIVFARDVRGKPYWFVKDKCDDADTDNNDALKMRKQKQMLQQQQQLSFNVSHHGNYIILAGVYKCNNNNNANTNNINNSNNYMINNINFGVGVDIMKIEYSGGKSLQEFFRIMRRKFSNSEWKHIMQSHRNNNEKLQEFMRNWCLKEAYVKELGVGITIDLEQISFTLDNSKELESNSLPLTGTSLNCNGTIMLGWHFEEHLLNSQYCAAIAFHNCKPEIGTFQFLQFSDIVDISLLIDDNDIINYCKRVLDKPRK